MSTENNYEQPYRSFTLIWSTGMTKTVLLSQGEFTHISDAIKSGSTSVTINGVGIVFLAGLKAMLDNNNQNERGVELKLWQKATLARRADQEREDSVALAKRALGR
jgi:hypothetical protein